MTDKERIIEKLADSTLTIQQIADGFGINIRTLFKRIKEENITHNRKVGRRKGQTKPLKMD